MATVWWVEDKSQPKHEPVGNLPLPGEVCVRARVHTHTCTRVRVVFLSLAAAGVGSALTWPHREGSRDIPLQVLV